MTDQYTDFLKAKVAVVEWTGIDVPASRLHHSTLPHQADAIRWMLRIGRGLLAASFGLGKTHAQVEAARIIVEEHGGKFLVVTPLGVRHQFIDEDGPRLGVPFKYVATDAEVEAADTPFLVTNYERIREGHITPAQFTGISLDEGSVLRSLGSDTYAVFERACKDIPFRYVATATPSPNNYNEIINYADFLGHMDRGQALTRWFKRNPDKAGDLTVHPHLEKEFWTWVASWALFINKPSDLGHSDEGYDLPEMRVHWHRIPVDHSRAFGQTDSFGQHRLLLDAAGGVREASEEKRATLSARLAKAQEIMSQNGQDTHWLIWHHLEAERSAIEEHIPAAVTVYGSQDLETREQHILDFSHGRIPVLATKPEIAGSGCNFQRHCHSNIFLGVDYRFQDFIQAVHRTHRFQQTQPVDIHIIYAESEDGVVDVLKRKWRQHDELTARMSAIIREHGLSEEALRSTASRSLGVARQQHDGQLFTAINNDCVEESRNLPDSSIGLWLTSIPFGNHYEYVASLNDFGHNEDDATFFKQMDFLIPEMYRSLQPGRMACIHVKDRIMYGWQGEGFLFVNPFSDKTVAAFQKHGFLYQGRITVVTDVVRENNSTYRLGYTEMCKDGTKMGVGLPEYVLLFRKPPSDNSDAYADVPVVKSKDAYSIGRWQLDAHSFWRSNGDRLLQPWEAEAWYDYQAHVGEMDRLERKNALSKSFLMNAVESPSDRVWTDVNFMRGLNAEQSRKRLENHVCPLPFDIVERLIERYSNAGDLVADPFAGLFTVPYCAVKNGRRGFGTELNPDYYKYGLRYMQDIETQKLAPTLFDLLETQSQQPEEQDGN
ncbi:MAG: hypothetical protein KF821_01755 [Anaerolineales bacterium]|jgi:DNA modification methylase|nr:hypothetical protein [Anaerolineales bacterium]